MHKHTNRYSYRAPNKTTKALSISLNKEIR